MASDLSQCKMNKCSGEVGDLLGKRDIFQIPAGHLSIAWKDCPVYLCQSPNTAAAIL